MAIIVETFKGVVQLSDFVSSRVRAALKPGEEIGEEVHEDRDQFFRVEQGAGEIGIDGAATPVKNGMAMIKKHRR